MAKGTGSPFATFLIIGPTCFFLGILFASFPYDYFVLWSTPSASTPAPPPFPATPNPNLTPTSTPLDILREPYLSLLEHHVRILYASPPLISRLLHMVIGTGLAGLLTKLYKPSEANMLFDGASLVLYIVGITVYISNMVKGMRVITAEAYGSFGQDMMASKYGEVNDEIAAAAAAAAAGGNGDVVADTLNRADTLRVFAASNTILALVLVGVLILQAGQWYAQKKEAAEIEEMDRAAAAAVVVVKKKGGASAASGGAGSGEGDKKKQ